MEKMETAIISAANSIPTAPQVDTQRAYRADVALFPVAVGAALKLPSIKNALAARILPKAGVQSARSHRQPSLESTSRVLGRCRLCRERACRKILSQVTARGYRGRR